MLLPPDISTEELSGYFRSINQDDLTGNLAAGEALRLLIRIEAEDAPLASIPALVARCARVATLSLSPPPKPS